MFKLTNHVGSLLFVVLGRQLLSILIDYRPKRSSTLLHFGGIVKPRAPKNFRPPSSLAFLATGLALHTVLAAVWVCIPIGTELKLLGLTLSFSLLVAASRHWWVMRTREAELQAKISPAHLSDDSYLKDDLQRFIVEHMQFAVLSVWSDLGFHLETKGWPANFGEKLESSGEDLVKWLGKLTKLNLEDQNLIRFQMQHAFGMNSIQWNVCSMTLPREASLRTKGNSYIRISYIPLFKDEKLEIVHIILQDISEIKEREDQAQQQRKEMEKFFALLQVSDSLFELFMSETRKLFDEIKQDLKILRENKATSYQEVAGRMFRAVHTIKANARLFKLNSIQDVAHQVENFLDELRSGARVYAPKTIGELTMQIMTISEEVYSYASLRKEILNTADRNSGFNLKYRVQWIRSLMNQFASVLRDPKFEQRHLQLIQKEFSRALSSFDKASLKEYIRGYSSMIQDVAMQLGKEVGDLETNIEFHSFDTATLARINDIILHCMRNAIDHGVERPEDRVKAGKLRKGTITLSTEEKDGVIKIEIKDDGRGIDVERVKAKAVEKGFISAEKAQTMSQEEAVSLLFQAGVSTADTVTEISGRGFGMDVVRDYVQGLNGQLKIDFEKGGGTTISIWIPAVSEEQIIPLAVHDLNDILSNVSIDSRRYHDRKVEIKAAISHSLPVFTDRSSVVEVIRMLIKEMHSALPPSASITIEIDEHFGRRRVDSHIFYRLKINASQLSVIPLVSVEERGKVLEAAGLMIRRNGGSLFVKSPHVMEVNIPSNIPVRFNAYPFNILVITDGKVNLNNYIKEFFNNVMGGWAYRSETYPFAEGVLQGFENSPCIVLLDSALMKTYLELRPESDRKNDGVVLFPEEELDIDVLNGSAILPENILFLPPVFDEKNFQLSMASVIYRRFLKEMVRDSGDATEAEPLSSAS